MADPIRQALERLQQYAAAHPEHDTAELVVAALATLAAERPAPAEPDTDADPIRQALESLLAAEAYIHVAGPEYVRAREAARTALAAEPPEPDPREALAARPLLEAVARLGDCIGQHTVGEIRTISDQAAAWLRENPPGQPVAIEPRGCPTPGACSCVEPPAPAIGPEWRPCVKLPITVHVRDQRPDETHVSTREGITPVRPDDLIMRGVQGEEYPIGRDLFNRTYRLGAADPGDSAPAPAADAEEREELAQWLDEEAKRCAAQFHDRITRAAALLREARPQPVPVPVAVSQRLPEPGDCDTEGRC